MSGAKPYRPNGTCEVCGYRFRLCSDGTLETHYQFTGTRRSAEPCPGSRRPGKHAGQHAAARAESQALRRRRPAGGMILADTERPPRKFRVTDVVVVRGYFVVCGACGEDAADYGGHGLPTGTAAEAERQAHIAEHREPPAARKMQGG